jgi:hypothetical protein
MIITVASAVITFKLKKVYAAIKFTYCLCKVGLLSTGTVGFRIVGGRLQHWSSGLLFQKGRF